jgi:DNA uptake protein ComE-like DNA-binding protein
LKKQIQKKKRKNLFILFTTGESDIEPSELRKKCALVSKENFENYFGPFAGRAFRSFSKEIDLNKASFIQLTSIKGIGPEKAKSIIKNRPFKDSKDFEEKTNLLKYFPSCSFSNSEK